MIMLFTIMTFYYNSVALKIKQWFYFRIDPFNASRRNLLFKERAETWYQSSRLDSASQVWVISGNFKSFHTKRNWLFNTKRLSTTRVQTCSLKTKVSRIRQQLCLRRWQCSCTVCTPQYFVLHYLAILYRWLRATAVTRTLSPCFHASLPV